MLNSHLRFPESDFCGQMFHELMLHYRWASRSLGADACPDSELSTCLALSMLAQTCSSISLLKN